MAIKNSYPELPQLKYAQTSVLMDDVIAYIKTFKENKEVKAAAYAMFREESGNGRYGVNHNYIGAQADVGRWNEYLLEHVTGTLVKKENDTGDLRRFLTFDSYKGSIDFLMDRVKKRGLYIGGTTHRIIKMTIKTPEDWALAYWRDWVKGNPTIPLPDSKKRDYVSMLKQGETKF